MAKPLIVVIAHDIRSAHNVGSLLRTAEGLGILHVYLTGYSPFPPAPSDSRLPHEQQRVGKQIAKSSLGAEDTQPWSHHPDPFPLIASLRSQGFTIAALEQAPDAVMLPSYDAPERVCLVLGNETEGVQENLLHQADVVLEIPMAGAKESFNVVQAAAMALYQFTFDLRGQ